MLTKEDYDLAVEVLVTYETAWYENSQAVSDIRNGLCWDRKQECFSMDFGFALRGEAEDVRIYRGVEDYVKHNSTGINRYEASVVYNGEVYFIETAPFRGSN